MPFDRPAERKSADHLAWLHYLRTGQRLTTAEWLARQERKFNPYHDAQGRFTSPPGVTVSWGNRTPHMAERPSNGQHQDRSASANPAPRTAAQEAGDKESNQSRAREFLAESQRAWKGSDGVPNDERWEEWARQPARPELSGTQAPEIVYRIRNMDWTLKTADGERTMTFSEIEDRLLDKSTEFWASNILPPYVREHAVFVYESVEKPGAFTARIVEGDGATTVGQLNDFTTGEPLELRQLPQLDGYRLVMVEHTHPVATSGFGARGYAGPSNKDMYIAAANPGVAFVVNQVDRSDLLNEIEKNTLYYFGF